MAAVLDGATVRTDTGCVHSVPWFVENLAGSLARHREISAADALTAAISETAAAHRDTCDLGHPGTPSAALAIAQVYGASFRYLVLGDVTLAIETTDGVRIITDNRVDSTATAERAAAGALPAGSPQKAEALVRMKHAELAARNVPGGFWIAAARPGCSQPFIDRRNTPPRDPPGCLADRRGRKSRKPVRGLRLARHILSGHGRRPQRTDQASPHGRGCRSCG